MSKPEFKINSVVKSKVTTFVRKMSEKYGEEEVNLARVHFQTWGSGFACRSYALSLEHVLRTLFSLVFGIRKSDSKIFVQQGGVEQHYDDDAFGTVCGAIQMFLGLKVNEVRPRFNLIPKSLSSYHYNFSKALQEFDEELFMEKVLPTLDDEMVETWDEINTYEETERKMAKWGFLSDLFTEYRVGQRAHPAGFCEAEPDDALEYKEWNNALDDPNYDPCSRPVYTTKGRKFLLSSVKEAAKDNGVVFRERVFEGKIYILFGEPPKDLFSIIGSKAGCPDMSWINFKPGMITEKPEPIPKDEVISKKVLSTETSVQKIESWADECEKDRPARLAAGLRRQLVQMGKINNIPIDDRERVRCANQEGLEFWTQVPRNSQRKAGSFVRDGPIMENVDKLMEFFRDLGWIGSEEALEEFALCRLAVMNCKVLSNGNIKRP